VAPLAYAFSDRDTAVTAVLALVARLPIATLGIALPLLVLTQGYSPTVAGAALAIHRVAQATAAPFWGRAADRVRITALLRCATPLYGISCALLPHVRALTLILAMAALSGAVSLPFSPLMRALWNRRISDSARRAAANTYESFLTEAVLLGGRAVVVIALLVAPVATVITVQTVLGTVGGLALTCTGHLRGDAAIARAHAHFHARFQWLRLLPLYVGFFGLSASLGAFAIAVLVSFPAASQRASWAAAGITCWGLGSLIGVGPFTRLTASLPSAQASTRLMLAMAAMQAAVAMMLSNVGSRTMLALCLLAGLPIAAIVAAAYAELARLTPLNHQTEAFAWTTTCLFGGDAAGAAVAGSTSDLGGPEMFAVAVAFVLVAVLAQLGCSFLQPLGEKPGQPD
jgi:hypothetical protein